MMSSFSTPTDSTELSSSTNPHLHFTSSLTLSPPPSSSSTSLQGGCCCSSPMNDTPIQPKVYMKDPKKTKDKAIWFSSSTVPSNLNFQKKEHSTQWKWFLSMTSIQRTYDLKTLNFICLSLKVGMCLGVLGYLMYQFTLQHDFTLMYYISLCAFSLFSAGLAWIAIIKPRYTFCYPLFVSLSFELITCLCSIVVVSTSIAALNSMTTLHLLTLTICSIVVLTQGFIFWAHFKLFQVLKDQAHFNQLYSMT